MEVSEDEVDPQADDSGDVKDLKCVQDWTGKEIMRTKLTLVAPLLAAGAAAIAVAAAPIAAADPGPVQQTCTQAGLDSECQSPGNVQINDSIPADPVPFGGDEYLIGGWGLGGYHGGGFHGGGHGGGGHR